jgi:hypothetical protein
MPDVLTIVTRTQLTQEQRMLDPLSLMPLCAFADLLLLPATL